MRTLKEILNGENITVFSDKCFLDLALWAERVFGFSLKWFHIEWLNLVHKHDRVVIKAFRGSGKSTFFGVVYPLWLCWYRPGTEILFTSSDGRQAVKILDAVKDVIETNEFLSDLAPPNPSTWNKTELKMTNGSKIFCRPFTFSIKSIHPDYVFLDETQDVKDRQVYYKALMPTVTRHKGHLIAAGVTDHPADMLEELYHKTSDYVAKSYPILNEAGKSIWPEEFPDDAIDKIRRDSESAFQSQYMLNARASSENAVFPPEWIDNCFCYEEKFMDTKKFDDSICILGADFAQSQSQRADFDAYVVVEKVSGKTIIRYGESHKLPKDAKEDRLRELYRRFKPIRMILDPSNIGEAIIQDLRNEALPVIAGEFSPRSRHKYLVNLQTMMQPDKNKKSQLVIPRDPEDPQTLTFTSKLVEELLNFKEVKSETTGFQTYVSKGLHDDTVMALALACHGAAQQKEFLDMIAI